MSKNLQPMKVSSIFVKNNNRYKTKELTWQNTKNHF